MTRKSLKILLLLFLTLRFSFFIAQTNLVPNPSFEDTTFCPWAENQMPYSWMCFGATPDYYNACSSALNVPNTPTGFHPANSGVGMIGVFTYVDPSNAGWPNYREFVGVQLVSPLTIGQKYYMSFHLSFARIYPTGWNQIGSDKLGIKFSTVQYSQTIPPLLNNLAPLYCNSIYNDTTLWVKITGSFIADSTYSYLMIGNFFDASNTNTLYFGGPPYWASSSYYFIDDVCVSTDSIYNSTWVGLHESEANKNIFVFYPNPTYDFVNLKGFKTINEISLINSLGQKIYEKKISGKSEFQFEVSNFPSGIYMIKVRTDSEYYSQQIIISH